MIKQTEQAKELSRIVAQKKYKAANKLFIKTKGKYKHDITKIKLELLDSIIAQRLIPDESMTNFVKCGLYEIEEIEKNLAILKANNKEGKI